MTRVVANRAVMSETLRPVDPYSLLLHVRGYGSMSMSLNIGSNDETAWP